MNDKSIEPLYPRGKNKPTIEDQIRIAAAAKKMVLYVEAGEAEKANAAYIELRELVFKDMDGNPVYEKVLQTLAKLRK